MNIVTAKLELLSYPERNKKISVIVQDDVLKVKLSFKHKWAAQSYTMFDHVFRTRVQPLN